MKSFKEFIKLFFKGAIVDNATDKINTVAKTYDDTFLTLVFSDRIGIPNPLYYYYIELLPYLAQEIKGWEMRIANRKTILGRAIEEIGEP
jgi:hypothetical protein